MKTRTFLSTLVCGGLLLTAQFSAHAAAPFVSLEDARAALEQSGTVMVDIREPGEQAGGVAKGALLMPMGQIGKRIGELPQPKSQPFLVICATQNRSAKIVEQLHAAGYTNASYVKGGMSQWASRGWPMIKP